MEPITRKEMYLAKISGDYSGTVPEPVTRMDYYMAYAAGAYSGQLPRPIVQQEFYWAYICGATDIDLPEPVTRIDMYLGAICGGMILLPDPITREEIYLAKIAKQSEAVIKSAEGKMIVLTDSLDAPFEDFRIYGRSTQASTTGSQLFNADEIKDGFVSLASTGEKFTFGLNEKYSNSQYYELIMPDGETSISWDFSNCLNESNDINGGFRVRFSDIDDICITSGISVKPAEDGFVIPEGTKKLYFMSIGGFTENVGEIAMVNVGTARKPYEPYTGGKPSPSPDYPQELVSAGDKGNIEVEVMRKNLISPDNILYNDNYWEYADGKWSTTNSNGTYVYQDLYLRKGTYTLSVDCESVLNETGKLNFRKNNIIIANFLFSDSGRKSLSCKITEDAVYRVLFGGSNENGALIFSKPQLEYKDQATDYEPYRTPQTLTLVTPNGLPGIPVSSGGNYTDESGQQWICDEIDFARGKYVQRVWKNTFYGSSNEGWGIYANNLHYGFYVKLPFITNRKNGFCNQLRVNMTSSVMDNAIWFGVDNDLIYVVRSDFYDDTLDDKGLTNWAAHLAEYPLEVMTYLDTPIETPIPAEELSAYAAMHTNTPTTVISNDAEAWMKIGYKAKPVSQYNEAKTLEWLKGE